MLHYQNLKKKQSRPYKVLIISLNSILFAIPFRSNISHPHVFWTDKANKCGLDFSKAVAISNPVKYIDNVSTVQIRQNEFNNIKGKDHLIKQQFESYVQKYILAYKNQHIPRNATLCKYSTLQYFHFEIGLI